ncbi:hypothetical protein IAU60_003927 [Kwoniella sp. DSM 27419]
MAHNPAQAYTSHLINQTLSSVALLESLGIIPPTDASLIRQKLPSPTGPFPSLSPPSPTSAFSGLSIGPSQSQDQLNRSWTVQHARGDSVTVGSQQGGQGQGQSQSSYQNQLQLHQAAGPPAAPSLPPRARPTEPRGEALWDFTGTEADDLQFRSGDTIIIDEEVNEEWYRGRVIPQGQSVPLPRSGLFPSTYIEKLPPAPLYSPPPFPPPQHVMPPYQGSAQNYYDQKPPPGQVQMMPPPGQYQPHGPVIVQEPEQKNKFGKIGGQLGTAFTGGIGFGAGSALASEAVHASEWSGTTLLTIQSSDLESTLTSTRTACTI